MVTLPNPPESARSAASFARVPYRPLLALTLLYFTAKLLFFALNIAVELPPDEVTHLNRADIFAGSWGVPDDGPETFRYGLIEGVPWLYNWVTGRVLNLLGWLPVADWLVLRLFNCGLGLLTVLYGLRWIRLMTGNRIVHLLFLVMITNVLMFTGLAAAVSYDNLINLLAVLALYYLFRFSEDRSVSTLAKGQLAVIAGVMTKTSFLPFAFILELVLLVRERKHLLGAWGHLKRALAKPEEGAAPEVVTGYRKRMAWVVVTVLAGIYAAGFYGTNVLVYGHLTPKADQVLSLEEAMQNRIFARNYIVRQFKEGNLSFEEAIAMTRGIHEPGNARRARNLIAVARDPGALAASLLGPMEYARRWVVFMLADGMGYHGHLVMRKWSTSLYPMLAILLVTAVLFIRKWQPDDAGGAWTGAAVVAGFYALVLLVLVNYRIYLKSGMLDYALQGRYIFPVLIPMAGIISYYLIAYLPRRSQVLVALLVAGYFIYGELPFFLARAEACWFVGAEGCQY